MIPVKSDFTWEQTYSQSPKTLQASLLTDANKDSSGKRNRSEGEVTGWGRWGSCPGRAGAEPRTRVHGPRQRVPAKGDRDRMTLSPLQE